MTSNLKPCPCCGHRAELREERHDYGIVWTIECRYCGLMIDGGQGVIDAWNSRRTDGMIAWLEEGIERWQHLNGVQSLHALSRRDTLIQCKKQLLKLLDGMGVE